MREDYFVKIGEELEAQASASANAEAEMRMRALAEEIEAAKEEINTTDELIKVEGGEENGVGDRLDVDEAD